MMLSSTGKNDESMNFNINVKRKDSSSPSSSFSSSTNSNSSSKRIKFNPIVYEKKYGVSKAPNDSEMNEEEAIDFFQELLDRRLISSLQGSYQRTAATLLELGHIEQRKGQQ